MPAPWTQALPMPVRSTAARDAGPVDAGGVPILHAEDQRLRHRSNRLPRTVTSGAAGGGRDFRGPDFRHHYRAIHLSFRAW